MVMVMGNLKEWRAGRSSCPESRLFWRLLCLLCKNKLVPKSEFGLCQDFLTTWWGGIGVLADT